MGAAAPEKPSHRTQRESGGRHFRECPAPPDLSGGGFSSGRVIGSTDARGYDVRDARVTPADLGATVFRHLGIDLGAQWTDPQGRPQSIVTSSGRPIAG